MEGTSRRCYDTQIVDGKGNYNVEGVKNFMTATNFSHSGRSYFIVAILGPQHGGKSTIMNRLFGTNFQQMDSYEKRKKTTEGIWIDKSAGINDPPIIAMDMEGTDGKERGEDDTIFEKQSALLALAVADVVMINMWCHDLGREQAASKPLLKIVFEVMTRMFSPRKVTLLFVLRDKTLTPFVHLKADVEEQVQEIWNTVNKRRPDQRDDFTKYFHVEVVALSSSMMEERFTQEVAQMRERYFGSNLLERDGDTRDRLPASEFAFSTEQIWNDIKRNKDLDIPTHRVMVENYRCEEIANEKLLLLCSDEGWLELKQSARAGLVSGFGKTFRSILDTYLTRFDEDARYFDEVIRYTKRQALESKAVDLAYLAFLLLVANYRSKALEDFNSMFEDCLKKKQGFDAAIQKCMLDFDEACTDSAMHLAEWGTSEERENLRSDINRQLAILRDSKLSVLVIEAKHKLATALSEVIGSLTEDAGENMWIAIRACLEKETEESITDFAAAVAHLKLDESVFDLQKESLRDHARNVAEGTVRKEEGKVPARMFDRFSKFFHKTGDIKKSSSNAQRESLKLLASMAAMRFTDKADNIQQLLFSVLIDGGSNSMTTDPLACSKWDEVSFSDTLITPVECKKIWSVFINTVSIMVNDAIKDESDRNWNRGVEACKVGIQTAALLISLATRNPAAALFLPKFGR